jgi:hypothetical protein
MTLQPINLILSPAQARYFAENPDAYIQAKDDRGFLLIGNWDGEAPDSPEELGGIYLTPTGAEWYGGCGPKSGPYDPQVKLAAYLKSLNPEETRA